MSPFDDLQAASTLVVGTLVASRAELTGPTGGRISDVNCGQAARRWV
ncbi:hypothetical protein [Streptomyces platensis]|nr:hypothetical protein [Streptomyces platensis]